MTVVAENPDAIADALAELACGMPRPGTDFGDAMLAVHGTTILLARTLSSVTSRGGEEAGVLRPFLARSLLEVGLTAIIGRLDPFRILSLRKVQAGPDYDLGKRANSAVQWFGDIQTKDGAQAKWDSDRKADGFSRAVLDGCWNELAWTSAVERATTAAAAEQGYWLSELKSIEPKNFVSVVRGRLMAVYSSLSKGVHSEFVIDRSAIFDPATVDELSSSAVKHLTFLCFVSHFIDHCAISTDGITAISNLKVVEGANFS